MSNFHLPKKSFFKKCFLAILKGVTASMDYEMLLSEENDFALKTD